MIIKAREFFSIVSLLLSFIYEIKTDVHVYTTDYQAKFCPDRFWATTFRKPDLKDSLQAKYGLYTVNGFERSDSENRICSFCEKVSCFIMRQNLTYLGKKDKSSKLVATCQDKLKLPHHSLIETYLDCVKVGTNSTHFILFIYLPRLMNRVIEPVDCVDPNFLNWLPMEKENIVLKGLELGFPMRRYPKGFLINNAKLFATTQYICLDGSGLTDNSTSKTTFEIKDEFKEMRLIVIRKHGLVSSRRPPTWNNKAKKIELYWDNKTEELGVCHIEQEKNSNTLVYRLINATDCCIKDLKQCTNCDDINEECTKEFDFTFLTPSLPNTLKMQELGGKRFMTKLLIATVFFLIFGAVGSFTFRNWNSINLFPRKKKKLIILDDTENEPIIIDEQDDLINNETRRGY